MDHGTASRRTVNVQAATIQLAQLARNTQAEADTFGLGSEEGVTDPLQEFGRNAAAGVADFDGNLTIGGGSATDDQGRPIIRGWDCPGS